MFFLVVLIGLLFFSVSHFACEVSNLREETEWKLEEHHKELPHQLIHP